VFTDKLVAHIPSSFHGEIKKIYYKVDDVIQVGSTIMDIDMPDDAKIDQLPSRPSGEKALASPAAWHIARQSGIDINLVHGTGMDGWITREDIVSY